MIFSKRIVLTLLLGYTTEINTFDKIASPL